MNHTDRLSRPSWMVACFILGCFAVRAVEVLLPSSPQIALGNAADSAIDEQIVTGESVPAEKFIRAMAGDIPLAERDNMLYMSTVAETGRLSMTESSPATE